MTEKQAKELLNRACDIITSLEGYAEEAMTEYQGSYTQRNVDAFFNEVDMLNEGATPYENYVATVKRNIDQAVEEMYGILKPCVSYSYMSEEEFNKRIETNPEFAAQWADLEAQDYDTFGDNKI